MEFWGRYGSKARRCLLGRRDRRAGRGATESEQEDQLSRGQQISHSLSKTADPEAPGTPVNTSVVRSLHCEAEVRPHGEHCPD